jgi:hypothetical protein
MFTETLYVVTPIYWNIVKYGTFTLWCLAFDLLRLDCAEIVSFEPMATKTLRFRSDCFAIISLLVFPIYIEMVFSGLSYLFLIGLEFLFAHHFATVVITDDVTIVDICLDVVHVILSL